MSSAKCKRSFSTINRVNTPVRSTMSDIRTSDLVQLANEENLANGVSNLTIN